MLEAMGSIAPGRSLECAKAEFLLEFRGVLTPFTLTLFDAEWDYLASLREMLYDGLSKTLASEPARVLIETVSLLRVFADAYHKKRERIDFSLFHAYVHGFTNETTLEWFRSIWDALELDKKQNFFRRLTTLKNFLKIPRLPCDQ
jgi:hypothetical protein